MIICIFLFQQVQFDIGAHEENDYLIMTIYDERYPDHKRNLLLEVEKIRSGGGRIINDHEWKRNSKKYIAGILTIALAVGAGQSYGSMEVSAQERTLPGIEKLVQDTVASSDGTFHILEIVPSKENATTAIWRRRGAGI